MIRKILSVLLVYCVFLPAADFEGMKKKLDEKRQLVEMHIIVRSENQYFLKAAKDYCETLISSIEQLKEEAEPVLAEKMKLYHPEFNKNVLIIIEPFVYWESQLKLATANNVMTYVNLVQTNLKELNRILHDLLKYGSEDTLAWTYALHINGFLLPKVKSENDYLINIIHENFKKLNSNIKDIMNAYINLYVLMKNERGEEASIWAKIDQQIKLKIEREKIQKQENKSSDPQPMSAPPRKKMTLRQRYGH